MAGLVGILRQLGDLTDFKRACELQPTDVRPHFKAGNCLYVWGKCKESKDEFLLDYEEAIYLKPDYADAHCDLASSLHSMGENERAIEVFQRAIDLKPGHVDALYNLGGLYMDRFQRASEMYTRVLALWPNHWR